MELIKLFGDVLSIMVYIMLREEMSTILKELQHHYRLEYQMVYRECAQVNECRM